MLPAAAADPAPSPRAELEHPVDRLLEQLAVELRSAEADQAAIGADPREESAVADGGDEAGAHACERLADLPGVLIASAIRFTPSARSMSSRGLGSASRQFGNSDVVPGTLGRSITPSASSSEARTIRGRPRASAA